jgi:hypothetical protein
MPILIKKNVPGIYECEPNIFSLKEGKIIDIQITDEVEEPYEYKVYK